MQSQCTCGWQTHPCAPRCKSEGIGIRPASGGGAHVHGGNVPARHSAKQCRAGYQSDGVERKTERSLLQSSIPVARYTGTPGPQASPKQPS